MLKNHLTRRAFAAMGCTLMLGAALAGCSSDTTATQGSTPADSGSAEPAAESVELQIFAANSLEKAMPEVEALYTEQTGVTFADTQYKGSGDLV